MNAEAAEQPRIDAELRVGRLARLERDVAAGAVAPELPRP